MAVRLITNLCAGGTGGCCECDCSRITKMPGGECDGCKYTVTVNISGSYAYQAGEDYECGLKYLNQNGYIQKAGDLIFSPDGSLELIENCSGGFSSRYEDCDPDGGPEYCCCDAEDCAPEDECYRSVITSNGECGSLEPTCSVSTEGAPPFESKVDTFNFSPNNSSIVIAGTLGTNRQIDISYVSIGLGGSQLQFSGPSEAGTYPITIQLPPGSPTESQTMNLYSSSFGLPGETKSFSASIIIS
jgi:hypothetical protein